jgi:hypothetical protein
VPRIPPLSGNPYGSAPVDISQFDTAASPVDALRYWKIPLKPDYDTALVLYTHHIAGCCYRNGKLWVEVLHDAIGIAGQADFFGVVPATFETEHVEFRARSKTKAELKSRVLT